MFVKLKINLGFRDYPKVEDLESFTEGAVKDVSEALGTLIVKRGHGIQVEGQVPNKGRSKNGFAEAAAV